MNVQHVSPILNVSSLDESFTWFAKLGWRKDWDFGDPPDFGAVTNGDGDIFLCKGGQGNAGTWIYLRLDSPAAVDALHVLARQQQIAITEAPTDMPWNSREILIRHPDGHTLRFGAPIEEG